MVASHHGQALFDPGASPFAGTGTGEPRSRLGGAAVEKQLPAAVVEVVIVQDADHDRAASCAAPGSRGWPPPATPFRSSAGRPAPAGAGQVLVGLGHPSRASGAATIPRTPG